MSDFFFITSDFYIYDLIGLLIIYQVIVFSVFLRVRKNTKVNLSSSLQAIYLTIFLHFSYVLLENNFLHGTYMLGFFFGLLYGPFFYLYTTSVVLDQLRARKFFIHFSPAIFGLVLILILNGIGSSFLIDNDSIFSVIVTIHLISYLVSSLLLLRRYTANLPQIRSSLDRIGLGWLRVVIYLILAAIVLALIESFVTPVFPYYTDVLITSIFLFVLTLVNCLYYLGFRQAALFSGFTPEEIESNLAESKYDIPESEKVALFEKLSTHMESTKVYRKFELSLNDLANNLDTSTRKLSLVINEKHQMNFFDYINSFRIKEVTTLLQTTDKSIKEVMYSCGFGNKSSFNAIFKKHTGETPSSFRKSKS